MMKFAAAAVVAFAGSANAQLLTVTVNNLDGTVTAAGDTALLDQLSAGAGFNLVSFFDFNLVGEFENISVGADFQSPIFGFVADDATGQMQGQFDNPPLGSYGSANPVLLGSFDVVGLGVTDLVINGQFDGAFDDGGLFPTAFNYQNADGSAGDIAFRVEIIPVPAPASAALLGLAGLAGTRRRG